VLIPTQLAQGYSEPPLTMRLKRVKIFGFKTFADKTEFSLDGGIVAVVGPNGCGKSNLVDAILWALGEGSIKNLRAASSQDVIFSGSQKRKSIGYAEVSLCFDNEDGSLPIEASEVWVTRKLTRSGDSDYSINRQSCRLRDVLELLADSGLGRAGYAIVGQKEIDQALSASAEDRRAWIDEAAGVQRYRARKVESLRRLDSTRGSLIRVDDILRELEAQREPLAEEAEIARRYKSLLSSLKEVEIGLLVRDFCTAVRELVDLEDKISSSTKTLESEQITANQLEEQSRFLAGEISEIEQEIDTARSAYQAASTSLERSQANIKITEERLTSLSAQESNLTEDSENLSQRVNEATQEVIEAESENEASLQNLTDIQNESAGASSESKALTEALRESESKLNKAREQKNQRLKWEAEQEAMQNRLRLLKRELEGAEKGLPEIIQAVNEAGVNVDSAKKVVEKISLLVEEKHQKVTSINKTIEQDASSLRQALAERASIEGRIRGIEATLDAFEGLSQGSRAVLEAAERGLLPGTYLAVGSAIETDKDYSLAIETALGASANDLIVGNESEAKRAIAWLKENRAGRCTFQPISLMRTSEVSNELRKVLNEKGVIGRASELVDCDSKVRPVIDSLLGRIVIVDLLEDALKLAKTHGWTRIVTLDGEVVHSSGAVAGGQNNKQSYGIVQRKADLAELEKQLIEIEKQLAGAEKRRKSLESEIEKLNKELVELKEQEQEAKVPLIEAQEFFNIMQSEFRDADRQVKKAQAEIEQIQQTMLAATEDVDVSIFEKAREELLMQVASKSADAEQAVIRLRDAQERARQAQSRLYSAKKRLEVATESHAARGKKLENLGPERERLLKQIESFRLETAQFEQEKSKQNLQLDSLNTTRREKVEHGQKLNDDAKSARENVMALGHANHQNELLRVRAETKRATVAERLLEEYAISEEEALNQEAAHTVEPDAHIIVGRLRREIKAMGEVNVGAVEAFEKLTERFDSMSLQRDDILKGIEQVEASIAELDKLTRDRFLSTFDQVKDHFTSYFQQLFGGGTANIELTDSNKILESGVEITVQLPGKKQQPLQLLSGGERSLCASAFLFSLLTVKPAPLVVLDEVDAPLDGRNVERFAEALVGLSKGIQFIVITHNPTTIEVAPTWLGVTMQEPGVSTLVPARLPESKAALQESSRIPETNLFTNTEEPGSAN
jgi:chromosome segregation protein